MALNVKKVPQGLNYLNNKPRTIRWEVVANGYDKHNQKKNLSYYESYDLLYDSIDFKIRGLKC